MHEKITGKSNPTEKKQGNRNYLWEEAYVELKKKRLQSNYYKNVQTSKRYHA